MIRFGAVILGLGLLLGGCGGGDGSGDQSSTTCEVDNGGCEQVCTTGFGGSTCSCDDGYELSADGVSCETISPCAAEPCLNGGACVAGDDSYSCECVAGFEGDDCETVSPDIWAPATCFDLRAVTGRSGYPTKNAVALAFSVLT